MIRMKLFGVIAHLFHSFKAGIALIAHVQTLLMRYLLVLHQFFDLPEFASTLVTLVLFKKHIDDISPLAVIVVIPSIPALPAEVAFYLPGRLRMVIK
jgi:hypothetical protein